VKLVIDTNTIISGSLWQGPPARLIVATLAGQAQMFISLPLLLELQETFQHPKFASRLAARSETPVSITARFRSACHEAVPATKPCLTASCRLPNCVTRMTRMFWRAPSPLKLTRL
jgi:putative PIN family toxin of toxin-antitoxin system